MGFKRHTNIELGVIWDAVHNTRVPKESCFVTTIIKLLVSHNNLACDVMSIADYNRGFVQLGVAWVDLAWLGVPRLGLSSPVYEAGFATES